MDSSETMFVTGSADGDLRVWDLTTGHQVRSLPVDSPVMSLALPRKDLPGLCACWEGNRAKRARKMIILGSMVAVEEATGSFKATSPDFYNDCGGEGEG